MGALYSKISTHHLDKDEEKSVDDIEGNVPNGEPFLQKTPCNNKLKYLLDPRSPSSGINRTPIVINDESIDTGATSVGVPYLETDLDASRCTIRTSTPVLTASPIKDLLESSPVLHQNESFDDTNEKSISQQEEVFNLCSGDENIVELLNHKRMLFDSDDDNDNSIEVEEINSKVLEKDGPISVSLTEESNQNEDSLVDKFTKTGLENIADLSSVEDGDFSYVKPSDADSVGIKVPSINIQPFTLDNRLIKTKTGRTPLGIVSSNPCSPLQQQNQQATLFIINKDNDNTKPWRGFAQERVNRGLMDIENTPPASNLPPPDLIQSAPGKLANRGRAGKVLWDRDNSLVI